jgi:type VI secretion system protein ImpA
MPSPPIVDIEALLAPIEGENPAGESLRYAGIYDQIQEARRSDDDLAQGEWVREIKASDWAAVIEMATDALATRSKDLQIATWLGEALVKQHGFAGLRDGLRLLCELQERFWDSLYPEVEDGDLEFRAAPLEWLNEKLPASIRQVPVAHAADGEGYSWLRWQESRTVDNLGRQSPEALQAALAEGKITGEQFDKAVAAVPRANYEKLFEDVLESAEECGRLDQLLDKHFGREAPGLSGIKKAIEDCRALIESIVKKKGGLEPEPRPARRTPAPEAGVEGLRDTPSHFSGSPPFEGGMMSLEPQDRADALRRLAAVATYFRNTEPHSPISYLVQRAVRWGEMPLEQWLEDVIHDASVLSTVRETLGLKESDGNSDGPT